MARHIIAVLGVAVLAAAVRSQPGPQPKQAIVRFRANGNGTIGERNISIDGRGGGATAAGTDGQLALSGLSFPEIKLAEWEELGQYRLIIEEDKAAGSASTISVDFTRGTMMAELRVNVGFKICSYPFKKCETSETSKPVPVTLSLSSAAPGARALDEFGQARVVGGVVLEKTGYILLDNYFSLPAKTSLQLEIQVQFPDGAPESTGFAAKCRGGKSPFEAPSPLYFESLVSELAIGTGLPPFQFDPAIGNRQPGGPGEMSAIGLDGPSKGKATFVLQKGALTIAPLEVLPAIFNISLDIPVISINISVISDLTGTLDVCTGELEMLFNATFTPEVMIGNETTQQTPLSVATVLTTEVSTGFNSTRTGIRFDKQGSCRLVGVAKVPLTDDWLENWILSLPNDAITEMPSFFTVGCAGIEQIRAQLKC